MHRPSIILLLLLTFCTAHAGDWIFRPTSGGRLQIIQQGGGEQGPDSVVLHQRENEIVNVQVMPAGMGQCKNGALSGVGELEKMQLSMIPLLRGVAQSGQRILCGESYSFDAPYESQWVGVKAEAARKRFAIAAIPSGLTGQRILLGYVNFIRANSTMSTNPIYLDLTTLVDEMPIIKAEFDRPALRFGEVNVLKNNIYTARLAIHKLQGAGDAAMSYTLKLESSQQRENSFRLSNPEGDITVPYQIKIGSQVMMPDTIYNGFIPAGNGAGNILGLSFSLSGKEISGLAAGTHLTETLTAVITPIS